MKDHTAPAAPAAPRPEPRSRSPEARRRAAARGEPPSPARLSAHLPGWLQPGSRAFEVIGRTASGTAHDGFIHAGNLAYLALLTIFPCFILGAALLEVIGGRTSAEAMIAAIGLAFPPAVAQVIAPVAGEVMAARSGWLLWVGAGVALWTITSFIETIRDILRRAYGTRAAAAFWRSRLLSAGLILAAMVLLILSLFAQVAIGAVLEVIDARLPQLADAIAALQLSRLVPALALGGSLWVLFAALTPADYRPARYPKWPGALLTALWWVAVAAALPMVLRGVFAYDLTYGSLAGTIVTLLFFWLVGLGLVIGAQVNAALAEPVAAAEET